MKPRIYYDQNFNCASCTHSSVAVVSALSSGQGQARDKNGKDKGAREKRRRWIVPLSSHRRRSRSLFVDLSAMEKSSANSMLYQGETFLINDKPYLI